MAPAMNGNLDILPAAQRSLWDDKIGRGFPGCVLYGGTALALRLGHRESVDFDVVALLRRGESLSRMLGCAKAVYRGEFPVTACLKSLTWFEPVALAVALAGLSQADRQILIDAAVKVENIPEVAIMPHLISFSKHRAHESSRWTQTRRFAASHGGSSGLGNRSTNHRIKLSHKDPVAVAPSLDFNHPISTAHAARVNYH